MAETRLHMTVRSRMSRTGCSEPFGSGYCRDTHSSSYPRLEARDEYRQIGMALGITVEDVGLYSPAERMQEILRFRCLERRLTLLEVADYWLAHGNGSISAMDALDEVLVQGRSAWRVQRDRPPYLARRIAPEVHLAAEAMTGRPGEHLSRAWRHIYGRVASPSEGYREAVKAVEAAAGPIASPANARRTLGTIIRDLEAKPEKWVVRLRTDNPKASVPTVTGMLDILWTGQTGRHADPDPDPTAPLDVTQEDAEAALHLALTLVQWFTSGVVTAK
jgi:hypothetical protein